jgi:para-nitrobenzyl esterase
MLRTALAASLVLLSTNAYADTPASEVPAANRGYSVVATTIAVLMDDTDSKAILEKHLPGISANPNLEMARGFTLKQIQSFAPDQLTDEKLAAIDADLAKLPPK